MLPGRLVPAAVMLPVYHAYHCWADGAWQQAAREHAGALRDSGFRADGITVGLVGSAGNVSTARDWFTAELTGMGPLDFVTAETGFEQVTLTALRAWALDYGGEAAVLYAHTRGALVPDAFHAASRQAVTAALLAGWREHTALLRYYDVTGLDLRADPHGPGIFFFCNFWWARASYLARLPVPLADERYQAEVWIGLGGPRAYDLQSGQP